MNNVITKFNCALRMIIGIAPLLLTACATNGVNSIWLKPEGVPAPYQHLIVLGIANHPKIQRAYEDAFVQAFKAQGLTARSSEALVPALNPKRSKTIQTGLLRAGADAVLVTHLVAEPTKSAEPLPVRVNTVPEVYRQLAPYYQDVYFKVMRTGYYSGYQELRLESNCYDTKTGALLWSGRSQPLDPNSEQTIGQVMAQVVMQLRDDRLLALPRADRQTQTYD
ncbi:hypothetical protein [Chromatium okenii]|uniref:hypothetical protein n=1 Tax=Chromatium okenii TaxID=61644 RepID=UPI0026EFAD1F|nr:hypothetical protein [Chromatium okenii]MBV5310421.1 hypothetical protein [Chromatium okenii]